MLQLFQRWCIEPCEGIFDILLRHGYINLSVFIIPVNANVQMGGGLTLFARDVLSVIFYVFEN